MSEYRGRQIVLTGRNPDADIGTEEVAAVVRGTLPTSAAVASSVSGDAADDGDPAGTGAQTLLVRGLDASFNVAEETVTLNGTGAVATTQTFIRVNETRVVAVGSGGVNAGVLTTSVSSQAQQTIPIGHGRSSGLFYAVPANHHLVIRDARLYSGELATTDIVRYQVQARKISTVNDPESWSVLAEGDLFWDKGQDVAGIVIPAQHEFRVVAVSADNDLIVGGNVVCELIADPGPQQTLL